MSREELVRKLSRLLEQLRKANPDILDKTRRLALSMNRFSWHNQIASFDDELERLGRMQSD